MILALAMFQEKKLLLADMLSWAIIVTPEDGTAGEGDVEIHALSVVTAFVCDITLKRQAEGTSKHPYLHDEIRSVPLRQ